jgi:hypothetical protein
MTMIKVFDPFPRAPQLSLEQFSEHWSTNHAAIARRLPQILLYVQTHRRADLPETLTDGFGPTWCDGSSETWYADVESLIEMTRTPVIAELMQDEARFMDLDQPRFPLICDPQELYTDGSERGRQGVKALLFLRRRRDLSVDDFRRAWIVPSDAEASRALGATRHVVCPALPATYEFLHPNADRLADADVSHGELPFDGVAELWWSSLDDVERGLRDSRDAWQTLLHHDAADISRSLALFGREVLMWSEPQPVDPTSEANES